MSKTESDALNKIDTNFLKKHDYFCGWKSGSVIWSNEWSEHKDSVSIEVSTFEQHLRIYYTQTDRYTEEKKDFDYKIPLTTTPCHYGGSRYWFICPWYKSVDELEAKELEYFIKMETISHAGIAIISRIRAKT